MTVHLFSDLLHYPLLTASTHLFVRSTSRDVPVSRPRNGSFLRLSPVNLGADGSPSPQYDNRLHSGGSLSLSLRPLPGSDIVVTLCGCKIPLPPLPPTRSWCTLRNRRNPLASRGPRFVVLQRVYLGPGSKARRTSCPTPTSSGSSATESCE